MRPARRRLFRPVKYPLRITLRNGDDGSAMERRACMRDVREDLAWVVASREVTPWTE
jgi:hypothetical protein